MTPVQIQTKTQMKNNDWVNVVNDIIKKGGVAEVKMEKDNIVVIEIKRQVKNKTTIIG